MKILYFYQYFESFIKYIFRIYIYIINKCYILLCLDISVDMLDDLDLSELRSSGKQSDEVLLPENESKEPGFVLKSLSKFPYCVV